MSQISFVGVVLIVTLASLLLPPSTGSQKYDTTDSETLNNIRLNDGWRICRDQPEIPKIKEKSNVSNKTNECIDATLPTTIVAAEVKARIYPDPFIDMQLNQIPDISDEVNGGREHYTRWFLLDDLMSSIQAISLKQGPFAKYSELERDENRYFIHFRGVQYRAEVVLFGKKIGEISGMFRRMTIEITDSIRDHLQEINYVNPSRDSENVPDLAVHVFPVDHFGKNVSGQGGTHEMAKNGPVAQFAAGWDWIRYTPDRHTGIWDIVELRRTGAVSISKDDVHFEGVVLSVADDLLMGNVSFRVSVSIDANEHYSPYTLIELLDDGDGRWNENESHVIASKTFGEKQQNSGSKTNLHYSASSFAQHELVWEVPFLENMKLWWPYQYGKPYLYTLRIRTYEMDPTFGHLFENQTSFETPSDTYSFKVAFRNVSFIQDSEKLRGPVPMINGQRIFLTGGNWIVMDQFLRGTGDKEEYRKHIKMHKAMGLDVIRVWGGGIAERPEFYEVCDEEGVLVWQEFWMTGDNNGRWAGNYSWPTDHDLFMENVENTVKMLRNHPSLGFWCLGNEIEGKEGAIFNDTSFNDVRGEESGIEYGNLLNRITKYLRMNDEHRFLWQSSMGNISTWSEDSNDLNPQSAPKDGGYKIFSEQEAWSKNPEMSDYINGTLTRLDYVNIPFNPEIGSSAVPVYETMKSFLVEEEAINGYPKDANESVSEYWDWHKYEGWLEEPGADKHWIYDRYSEDSSSFHIQNASDFSEFAQLAHYDQTKLLFESHLGHLFDWYSGFFYWKTQSPWPAFRGFLYDWKFRTTGGFYGAKIALTKYSSQTSMEIVNANEHQHLNLIHAMVENVDGYGDCEENVANLIVSNRNFGDVTIPQLCIAGFDKHGGITDSDCKYNINIDGLSTVQGLMPETMHRLFRDSTDPKTGLVQITVRNVNEVGPISWNSDSMNEYVLPWMRKSFSSLRNDPDKSHLKVEVTNLSKVALLKDRFSEDSSKTNGYKYHIEIQVSVDQSKENQANTSLVFGVHIGEFYSTEDRLDNDDSERNIYAKEKRLSPILPVHCDSGYFSLHPNGLKTINCQFELRNTNGTIQTLHSIRVHGINAYNGEWTADQTKI